jgi:Protein of unknown function (DUF3108)
MKSLRHLSRFGALLAVCLAANAAAAERLTLRYSATWGGGRAADIQLLLDENGPTFRNQLDIETVGLARLLSGFRARAISAGAAEAEIAPRAFDAVYDSKRKRDKRIDLQFVERADGLLAEEGPNNTSTDPVIPEQFRRDVIDPLTSITAIRRLVRERSIDPAKGFTLAVYDGKHRFDVDGTVVSTETLRWGAERVQAINLRLLLRPVAGFDGESEDGYRPDANTRELQVTLTNDKRAIPIRMSVPIAYVPAVIVLDRDTRL